MSQLETQLLFPFVLDFALPQYVRDEKPFILQKHKEYVIKTHDPISMNDYLAEHYCNPDSDFYEAENYHRLHNPKHQHDGEIQYGKK